MRRREKKEICEWRLGSDKRGMTRKSLEGLRSQGIAYKWLQFFLTNISLKQKEQDT